MQKSSDFLSNAVGDTAFQIIKSVGISLVFSLFLSVAIACALRFFSVSEKVIYPINQGVKVLAVFVGCLAGVRGEKGLIKGVVAGLLFTALSYLTFSALGGDFSLSWWIVIELFLSLLSGAVGGAVAVNIRR
jgi:putative membrane protein (TIGR04086 family)